MTAEPEVAELMRGLTWSRGGCDGCGRTSNVTGAGSDEDGAPVLMLCFLCVKKDARAEIRSRYHDCNEHAVPYVSDGPLGHGWECGLCGNFLQAG